MYQVKSRLQGLGYTEVIFKSDTESSLLALKEAVAPEWLRQVNMEQGVMRDAESPVGEHASDGAVESAVRRVQGHVGAIRVAHQSMYRSPIDRNCCIVPWMVSRVAATITRFQTGEDGATARQRLKGKSFGTDLVEFGECAWYLKLASTGSF